MDNDATVRATPPAPPLRLLKPRAIPAGWPADVVPRQIIEAAHMNQVKESVYQWPGDVNAAGHAIAGLTSVAVGPVGQSPLVVLHAYGVKIGGAVPIEWASTPGVEGVPDTSIRRLSAGRLGIVNSLDIEASASNPASFRVIDPGAGLMKFQVDSNGGASSVSGFFSVVTDLPRVAMSGGALRLTASSSIAWTPAELWYETAVVMQSMAQPGWNAVADGTLMVDPRLTVKCNAGYGDVFYVWNQSVGHTFRIDCDGNFNAAQSGNVAGNMNVTGVVTGLAGFNVGTGTSVALVQAYAGAALFRDRVSGARAAVWMAACVVETVLRATDQATLIDAAGAFVGPGGVVTDGPVRARGAIISEASQPIIVRGSDFWVQDLAGTVNLASLGPGIGGLALNGSVAVNMNRAFVGDGGVLTSGSVIIRNNNLYFQNADGSATNGYIDTNGGATFVGLQINGIANVTGLATFGGLQVNGGVSVTAGLDAGRFTSFGQPGLGDSAVTPFSVDITTPTGTKTMWFMGGICYAVTG